MASNSITLKQIIIAFFAIFCLMVFFVLYMFSKNVGPIWPDVNNPSVLLGECRSLLQNPGEVEKDKWPESVKNLSPMSVHSHKEFVDIRISGGGIGAGWGYLVYPNFGANSLAPIDYIIRDNVYFGIYKYEAKE